MSVLWNKCVEELKYQISDNVFSMWIRPLSVTEQGDILYIHVPNKHFNDYIQKNYLEKIQTLVKEFEPNRLVEVKLHIESSSIEPIPSIIESDNLPVLETKFKSTEKTSSFQAFQNIKPYFTFDQFVTGKTNQLAYGICKEIANNLGQTKHNPLFLYGATGLGKTHLMQAVAHETVKQQKSYYYFSSDKFISYLVNAIQQSRVDEFKDKIKKADLLVIDDIHVIAGKRKSSEEFLILFNDFIANNKQIILASDRHPSALVGFDEYTKSRFLGGVSVAVEPPELEVRIQILQKKAKLQACQLPKDCAIFVAQHMVTNVRELEGALHKIVTMSRVLEQPITLEMVQTALKDSIAIRVQAVSMDNIRKVVAQYYEVTVKDLMGKKRVRQIARPRQIAMALARELTNHSFIDIGQSFGGRDHTTVMHACETVQKLCQTDVNIQRDYQALKVMLQT